MSKKDNHNLAAKLDLRRHFLRRHHGASPPRVMDCCQATGKIWKALRQEFPVETYVGYDLKKRKGRLMIDSSRVLAQPGWPENVIDVDTYGSPWAHWFALLPHVSQPTTVFLTLAHIRMGGGGVAPAEAIQRLGISFPRLTPPRALASRIYESSTLALLGAAHEHGLEIVEAGEVDNHGGSARYIGIHLKKTSEKGAN